MLARPQTAFFASILQDETARDSPFCRMDLRALRVQRFACLLRQVKPYAEHDVQTIPAPELRQRQPEIWVFSRHGGTSGETSREQRDDSGEGPSSCAGAMSAIGQTLPHFPGLV